MLEKKHQANTFSKWQPNWINLPGFDVVWFPNPGSPLVSRMSRGVAVSAVSGASVVFRVFKIYDPETYLPELDVVWFSNPGSPLVSRLSRLVVVSGASVAVRVSADTSSDIYLSF